MSKAGRLALIALAVAVAVVAFAVARPGDDDGGGTSTAPATGVDEQPTATAPSAPPPPPAEPTQPEATRIELRDHVAVGGATSIEVRKGDRVRIVVSSNRADDIHLHGYDIERSVAPGNPAKFSFPASIEGIFELESHEAEHEGKEPLIARLVVEPS
jgi:FtsP/CotA-like multicopper oxidase with cupredoxin domain